jgi:formylglycine-generating enzyme
MQRRKSFRFDYSVLVILVLGLIFISYQKVSKRVPSNMVVVTGKKFKTEDPLTNKVTEAEVKTFALDRNLVTVAEFDEFVNATGHITDAEKFGDGGAFDFETGTWSLVKGAYYLYPFGTDKPKAEGNHPVTQVSWYDAQAYAKWKGKRLPTQWEWELAAKNGEDTDEQYSWGDKLVIEGKYKANTWQGSFPDFNSREDGYEATSPVGVFGPNKLGLTDMGGNVWQWCADKVSAENEELLVDQSARRVLRGGSFLCDPMICHGYQITGRSTSTPESSMAHIGFRCARDLED